MLRKSLLSKSLTPTYLGYQCRVAPPGWLLSTIWDLQVTTAYSGWKMIFRQYVPISEDSEVFKVLGSGGSFDQLLELFNKGVASPFCVVASSGRTLLHVSDTQVFNESPVILLEMMSKSDASGRLGQVQAPVHTGAEKSALKTRASKFNEVQVQEERTENTTNLSPILCRALRGANIR